MPPTDPAPVLVPSPRVVELLAKLLRSCPRRPAAVPAPDGDAIELDYVGGDRGAMGVFLAHKSDG